MDRTSSTRRIRCGRCSGSRRTSAAVAHGGEGVGQREPAELLGVVFVNGADTKAAQIFTLAHELVHIWLGESAISDADIATTSTNAIERWCNQVAAEFLLPAAWLEGYTLDLNEVTEALEQLARRFKVSTLVALRRLYDAKLFTDAQYREEFASELARILMTMNEAGGSGRAASTTRSPSGSASGSRAR